MTGAGMIRRQVVELKVIDGNAVEVQDTISEISRHKVPQALENVFSSVSVEGQHLVIDRVELDLDSIPLDGLEEEFVSRLKRKLLDALADFTEKGTAGITDVRNESAPAKAKDRRKYSSEERAVEILRHFLRTGSMPWWAEHSANPEEAMEDVLGLENSGRFFIKEFEANQSLIRAVCQLNDSQLMRAACLIRPEESENVLRLMQIIMETETSGGLFAAGGLRVPLWSAVFSAIDMRAEGHKGLYDFLNAISGNYARAEAARRIERYIIEKGLVKERFFARALAFLKGTENSDNGFEGHGEVAKMRDNQHAPDGIEATAGVAPSALHDEEKAKHTGTEFFIRNAGVVILWPYLKKFFDALGLLNEKGFKDMASRLRAVHLIEFLTAGNGASAFEDALHLNKILCGVERDMPVPRDFTPASSEIKEADGLLTALISHWEALKNTSVDGLRKSFLLREGILIENEDGYLLRVERKAHDVLLEKLPWGISTIRLSWMTGILRVEW